MEEHPRDYLETFQQLAREYIQKHAELERAIESSPPEQIPQQLRLQGERSTDRFRAAQQQLLTELASLEPSKPEAYQSAITLCRCFDEMRILFQALLEHCSTVSDG